MTPPRDTQPPAAAPPIPPRQDGGASLSFVWGWHQGVTAYAALIADPAERCAYLEAQLVRLGSALEVPCDPR